MRYECPGVVVTDAVGVPSCTDGVGGFLAWDAVPDFDVSLVDNAIAGQAFAAGFVIVGSAWAIGRGFKYVLSMLS